MCEGFEESVSRDICRIIKISCPSKDIAKDSFIIEFKEL
jgi:hypothetical protein